MAAEKLTDIELDSIKLCETNPRSLSRDPLDFSTKEDDIETGCGLIHVIVKGDRSKPPIFTYHDMGLNSTTCFQGFFNYPDMQVILKHFCVYHINAPGQHEGALPLPQGLGFTGDPGMVKNYEYPTMDQLAEMLLPIMQYYELKSMIGFGVGAGANILARFALNNPDKVEGVVLINCNAGKASWKEWGYQKLNAYHLKSGNMSSGTEEYLLWHWFGNRTLETNHDLVHVYSEYIKSINAKNMGYFIESYIKRTDLGIVRETDPMKKKNVRNFRCPVMLVASDYSPHLNDTVDMNARMDPTNSTWMKFDCGGMILEENPGKLTEAFRLFLQGLGYIPNLSQTRIVELRQALAKKNTTFEMVGPRGDEAAGGQVPTNGTENAATPKPVPC